MPHFDLGRSFLRFVLAIATATVYATGSASGAEIHQLVEQGNLAAVMAALGEQPELINARDNNGRTPLHWACRGTNQDLVAALVTVGADVDAVDANHTTPLHSLAHRGLVDSMEILLADGASANVVNYTHNTPLHYAAAADQSDAVAALIAVGAELEIQDDYGRTALVLAAREQGGALTMKLLLHAGAQVGSTDRYGDDALSLAAWRGKRKVVNLLLAAGAPIPAPGPKAQALLEEAASHGLNSLYETLVTAGRDPGFNLSTGGTLIHAAAAGGSTEILRSLVESDLDLDQQDQYGWTPMHYAARDGRTDCAALLLRSGADTDIRNAAGQTPFNVAEEMHSATVLAVLRAVKANTGPPRFPRLEGPYLGQKPPTDSPVPFAIGIVSSIWGLHSSVAFSPRGDIAAWAPMVEIPGQIYSQGGIMWTSRSAGGQWTSPKWAPFSNEVDGDVPFFAPDGSRVYFISTRTHPKEPLSTRERIWYAERNGDGWRPARPVDAVVNDLPQHWQFSVDASHTIYFSTHLPTGRGGADLYRSNYVDGRWQTPIELGPQINSEQDEATPFIAADGSYLIFQRSSDLWLSFATPDQAWTKPQKLPEPINSKSRELCPLVSPDGKFLFFISNRDDNRHVWWVSAAFIEGLRPTRVTTQSQSTQLDQEDDDDL